MEGHWLIPGAIYRATNVLSVDEHRALLDYVIAKEHAFVSDPKQTDVDSYWCGVIQTKIENIGGQVRTIMAHAHGHLSRLHAHQHHQPSCFQFVYYFRSRQYAFTGGELRLWVDHQHNIDVLPDDNSLVIFSGDLLHQVLRVCSLSMRFVDSRFSVTGSFPKPAPATGDLACLFPRGFYA
jgi:Rps23 Pro-64 3,4-dihydroxylase Tpa1-like proline 4-hydroxylase